MEDSKNFYSIIIQKHETFEELQKISEEGFHRPMHSGDNETTLIAIYDDKIDEEKIKNIDDFMIGGAHARIIQILNDDVEKWKNGKYVQRHK